MRLSPTQIEQFDDTTPFGCARKWWFERVGGRSGGVMSGVELGSAVHTTLEEFLRGGAQGGLHALVIGAPGALEWLLKLRPRIVDIERKINEGELLLAGVPTVGRIDWIAEVESADGAYLELGDHKTTSSIAKYAKTSGEVKNSIQMNVYAKSLGSPRRLRITQDFYQTKGGKKFEAVSCETTKPEIESRILQVEATVEKMVKASSVTQPEDIPPNTKVCHIGLGCPHQNYCKRSGEFNMASLIDAFFTPAPPAPPPAPPTPEETALINYQAVLPPDAPKSEPVPPPAPVQVVEQYGNEPKGAGRPKGSKNKPKAFATPEEIAAMQNVAVARGVPGPVSIDRITIRHGAKIGLPNYSSATVEVEMSATFEAGNLDAAKQSLSMQVKGQMVKELEVYTQAKPTEVKP